MGTNELRSLCPALQNKTYFNYGGQGPLPNPSLEAITASWRRIQELGPFTADVWPLDDVVAGIPSGIDLLVEGDRAKAIASAIAEAEPNDLVLVAGKGHEDYQILGTEKVHFDDREEAERALRLRLS